MAMPPALDHFTERRHRALNTVHTWLLAAGSLVLLAVTAWAFGGLSGVIYATVFGIVSMVIARRISPQMVLAMYKAQPVSRASFPDGIAIMEELAVRASLPSVPKLHVIPSRMMNAFAVGRREESAVAITDALARNLTLRELAGVLAHEVSHIANEDVKVMAFADMVSRFTSLMSTIGLFSLFLNLGSVVGGMGGEPVPWLAVLVLIAAPTVGGLLQLALSRTREFDADLGAALLTGDPDGLASALVKLEKAQGKLWEGMMLPGSRLPDPSVLRSHPPTADRVARLMALKAGIGPDAGTLQRARELRPRPSLVPRIRPSGPTFGLGLVELSADPGEALADSADHAGPACAAHLARPDGDPRVRLTRGGVWW